jgi:DNA-binding LacI/PurR family transcriptional regulator
MAGVSRTTVSFVLNRLEGVNISETTRERVWEAARKLNYHPDAAGRKLASGKSNTLGLVLCQSPEQVFADAFLPRVIVGIEQAAMQEGFHVLLKPVAPDESAGYSRLIRENHVDGIIISGPRQDDTQILRLHREGVPIMLLGQLPETGIGFVDVNTIEGAEAAVDHLLEGGYEPIGMITNAPLSYTSAQQRREGYLKALRKKNIVPNLSLTKEGNYTPASGYHAMKQLLAETPRPRAVFVASDVVASGAILAVKRAGLRIPEDMAIVGFDDIPMAEYMDPPLTTVRLPAYGLGWAVSDRLIHLMRGEELDQAGLFLDSQLVIRESTVML